MQLSISKFLDTVEQSGLVEKSQLARSLADLARQSGPEAANDSLIVSSHLGRVGLLTDWQSKRLLEGRHTGFFLGKYKLLDHLGTGGMSAVFLAEHAVMRRRVAIKVLPKNRVNDSSYLARFHREARAVASLDHPNIVRAFDVDNDGDVHYLVMEYIEGCDLKGVVERDGPLAYRTAADYIRQAADGLGHAHQAGLVHRDVKPANLLVDGRQVVKVLDMGLARTSDDIDASLTKDHDERMLGTVDYLAPEQALDSHLVDPRADIYSLGCTLYFALTAYPPFPDGTLAQRVLMHQSKEPAPISIKRADVPAGLAAICRRMMAKSPAARFQSAAEVSEALANWIKRFDAGESDVAAEKPADDDLKLAPLEDEPARGHLSSAKSASESSTSAKSDTTKVERAAAALNASSSGKRPAAKPAGSSLKGPPGKIPPAAGPTRGPGSSITGPGSSTRAPGKSGGAGGSSPRAPGSSVKGPTRPSPTQTQPPSGSSVKGPSKSAVRKQQPSVQPPVLPEVSPLPELDPLASALPSGGLLDELLSDAALSGPALSQPKLLGRWDSPWFLILVGTLLACGLLGLIVAWHTLTG
ncbi:MAG TPA: protein kinase [Pirellulales bacterium]|nr:protein kinase [Pirellulales bacterium]